MSGILSKLAGRQGSTWGTAVALTTAHRLPFESCSLKFHQDTIPDNTITGRATRALPGVGGNKRVDGGVVIQSDYRQAGLLIACALAAAASPSNPETGVYRHVLPFTDNDFGKFLTIGHDIAAKRVEVFASLRTNRWLSEFRPGQPGKDSFDYLGRGMDDTTASSGWTFANDPSGGGGQVAYLSQSTIRVNAQAGGALGGSDRIYPTRFAVEVRRNLTQDYAQSAESEEPLPSDFNEVDVMLDFFTISTALKDLFREAYLNQTALKLDAVFTQATLLGATLFRTREYYLPSLRVVECPLDTPGPGVVPFSVRMTAHHASAVPTGFTAGFDEVLTVVLQNELSAALLA